MQEILPFYMNGIEIVVKYDDWENNTEGSEEDEKLNL